MQADTTPGALDNAPRDALSVLLLALPLPLARHVWGLLPVDVRMRCREVCPAWRDALAEPRLWTELDVTSSSGVTARVTPALLLAAAARAGGRLERVRVKYDRPLEDTLLTVVAANIDTLRLLRLEGQFATHDWLETLMRAAPLQCVVEAGLTTVRAYPGSVLRNEPPFQNLRLHGLSFSRVADAAEMISLAADMAAHTSLRTLELYSAPLETFAALDALVDAALALRLTKLQLEECHMTPASAVALSRLLHGDALRELDVNYCGGGQAFQEELLDAHAAALLADALRNNRTLTSLSLVMVHLWPNAGAVLLEALIGHASLTCIDLLDDADGECGALLGALVANDSPKLHVLSVSNCELGDDGLGPLVDALPLNTHLRELGCIDNGMSVAFARNRLMPALAANTSLQILHSGDADADALVAARTAATAAAAHD